MGNVSQILLVGDYAKGNDSGLIEVFLIGENLNMEYITQLEEKIERLIGRKVSFYLASKFLSDRDHIILFNINSSAEFLKDLANNKTSLNFISFVEICRLSNKN